MATTTTKKDELTIDATGSLSDALQQLIARYDATPTYVQKSAEQMRTQAEGEYGTYYDQLRLAAQQGQERTDLALQQQRASLQGTYDKQREASRKQYEDAYSRADRQMLSRGMQRSSYTAQILANLTQQGAEAQQAIWDQQAQAEGNIDAQRVQLAQQLAQQLMQYGTSQQQDVLNRIRELEDQEYQRGMTNTEYKNQLSTQIYQFMQQAEQDRVQQQQWQAQMDYQRQRDAIADAQWQQQFAEQQRQFNEQMEYNKSKKSSSGGSSGKKASTTTAPTAAATGSTGGMTWTDFMGMMGNAGNTLKNAGASLLNGLMGGTSTTPTVKTLQGPVNLDLMNKMNEQSATTGMVFRSALADAQAAGKTTTTSSKKSNNDEEEYSFVDLMKKSTNTKK